MRPVERMNLLEAIGTELQKRYTFNEIDAFLAATKFRYDPNDHERGGSNSKRVYAKEVLKYADEAVLVDIARELDIIPPTAKAAALSPPQNWKGTKLFRLFISHISKDKLIATRLKTALEPYAIAGFVAHEDIHPTLPWQDEIERALHTMDAFIAVHSPGFSASFWTQQEIGFALGRGTMLVSFRMGEDPTGFIGRHQALSRSGRRAEQIAAEIDGLLLQDKRTADRLKAAKDFQDAGIPF